MGNYGLAFSLRSTQPAQVPSTEAGNSDVEAGVGMDA